MTCPVTSYSTKKDIIHDYSIYSDDDIALLDWIHDCKNNVGSFWGYPYLLKKGLIEQINITEYINGPKSPYHFKLTGIGERVRLGQHIGSTVQVSEEYQLPFMHGEIGEIVDINCSETDRDGIDNFGNSIYRVTTSIVSISVKFPNHPCATWMFYKIGDLTTVDKNPNIFVKDYEQYMGTINVSSL